MANFDELFKEGDYLSFCEKYSSEDFQAFANLSGDKNKLHHDTKYSLATSYKEPIVPLHLSIAPLSRIAGMYLPGEPSLYLGHTIKALRPVFYDRETFYNAKIISINSSNRILTIRVLIIQESLIRIEAIMRVQSRDFCWEKKEIDQKIKNSKEKSYALITGSTGEIGRSVALSLASKGYDLLLHYGSNNQKIKSLSDSLDRYKCNYKFIKADLRKVVDRKNLIKELSALGTSLSTIVHTASSPANSNLDDLINTNFKALKEIFEASLASFLSRQNGRVIFISSIYLAQPVLGYTDYIAVKSMCTSYLSRLNNFYSNYDIFCNSILPSVVDTPYSQEAENITKLLPEEVAEKVKDMILEGSLQSTLYDLNGITKGTYGFTPESKSKFSTNHFKDQNKTSSTSSNSSQNTSSKFENSSKELLDNIIRNILNTPPEYVIESAAYGSTPGWDSLAQIQLVAEIENVFKIRLNSDQIEKANSYKEFLSLISRP